jgi:hypothetical protein
MNRITLALGATLAILPASTAAAVTHYAPGGLSGAQEVPANISPAAGRGFITISGDMMNVDIFFAGLTAPLTIAHIHCCVAAGANTGIAIDLDKIPLPTGLTGSFSRSFDLSMASTYRPAFITASGNTVELARARLLDAFNAETAYFNLHTSAFPGGEIRGQIAAVPEAGTWALLIAGFGLVGATARRRRPAHA